MAESFQRTTVGSSDSRIVCVTGAGGFIASWLVKLLLEKGYTVKGTVRNPEDLKNDHLRALVGASERLVLYKVDLLNYESLKYVFYGCVGIFHTACPTSNDPGIIMESAVQGTKNVMDVAAEVGVRRVVFTSTIGALHMDPNRDQDAILDESFWSDLNYCKITKNWYCYGKTIAEMEAWKRANEQGLELITVNPGLVVGPFLQSTVNDSINHVLKYLNGSVKTYVNAIQGYIDVRDVALVHLLVFESNTASGRYLCIEKILHRGELIKMLANLFPEYCLPSKCSDEVNPPKKCYKFNNKKINDLGLLLTPVSQSLYETVKCLQEKGFLPLVSHGHLGCIFSFQDGGI